ncbi:MAG: hypothetical protein V2A65_05080 [Candidatus Omnitrophota bacterium]
MQVIEAQVVDESHLKLMSPIQVPCGSKLFISITTSESDKEYKEWVEMSSQYLQSAYGPDEPDYSLERIKIPNPEFKL